MAIVMKNWFLSKSIKFKYLTFYLVIVLFSMAVLFSVYAYLYNTAQERVLSSNEMILESVKKDVDSLFQSINDLYYRISSSPKLLSLNELEPNSTDYKYQIFELRRDLFGAGGNHNGLDYYLYVRNGNNIIDGSSSMSIEKYYENFVSNKLEYDSAEEWHDIFFESIGSTFHKWEISDSSGLPKKFISFVYPIPFSRARLPIMYLTITVSEDELMGLYGQSFDMDDFDVFIRDREGKYLISTGNIEGIDTITGKTQAVTSYAKNSVTMSVLSQSEDYVYIVRSHNSIFWKALSPIVTFVVVSLILYVIAALILIRFLLKAAYNPIKELMALSGKSPKNGMDEFSVIKNVLLNTSEKLTKTETDTKMKSFLIGKAVPETVGELFQREFEHYLYFVALFKVGDLSFFFPEENSNEIQKAETANFIIGNVMEELLTNAFKMVRTIKLDEELAVVIMTDDADYKPPFEFAVNYAKQFINENFSFSFCTTVSEIQNDIQNLSEVYSGLVSAIEYSLLIGKNKIIYASSLNRNTETEKTGYYFSMDFETELENALGDGNCAYVKELTEQFFQTNFYKKHIDVDIMRLAVCDLLSTFLKSTGENSDCYSEIAKQAKACLRKLIKSGSSIDELKNIIFGIAEKICAGAGGYHEVKSISDIISIVSREYSNQDLNNDFIAGQLGVGAHYVSKLFKMHMDVNLHEYIQVKRVSKAKELLVELNLTNDEIAERVGLGSARNLLRMFKKYVGDTPAKYREKSRK